VTVLALNPGPTATNFFVVAGENARVGATRSPHDVVATGLRALTAKRGYVIDGAANRMMTFSARIMPRGFMARTSAAFLRKGTS
jgi:hypothetical protein